MYSIKMEDWPVCRDAISRLAEDHHAECKASVESALNLDIEKYDAYYEQGILHVVAARHDGEVVGYFVNILTDHMHDRGVLSSFNTGWYVRPDQRKGGLGLKLMSVAEEELKKAGVVKMYSSHPFETDLSSLFKRRGFTPIEINYMKRIA